MMSRKRNLVRACHGLVGAWLMAVSPAQALAARDSASAATIPPSLPHSRSPDSLSRAQSTPAGASHTSIPKLRSRCQAGRASLDACERFFGRPRSAR